MKNKIKMYLSSEERVIIIKSLNSLRTSLYEKELSTETVEEIISKVGDKKKLELDVFDTKVIVNALNSMRIDLKTQNQSCDDVNDILLKVINEVERKTDTQKGIER